MRKALIIVLSILFCFFAFVSVPALDDPDTCIQAAFIITAAYSWLGLLLWANLIHGRN